MIARACFLPPLVAIGGMILSGCLDAQSAIDSIAFATCPAGSFQMGASPGDPNASDMERPQHTVTFSAPFEISTCEITRQQWRAIMGADPPGGLRLATLNRPVVGVSWNDAQAFVARLNELRPEETYNLPTEAQWEYACRAGSTAPFFWGEDPAGTLVADYAWIPANSGDRAHDVGEKLPNAWGIYDMAGNAWEWVEDPYHADYVGAPTDGSVWEPGGDALRGVRGGSYYNAVGCPSAFRGFMDPDSHYTDYGFRIVRLPAAG